MSDLRQLILGIFTIYSIEFLLEPDFHVQLDTVDIYIFTVALLDFILLQQIFSLLYTYNRNLFVKKN